jgi:hypothetical protein
VREREELFRVNRLQKVTSRLHRETGIKDRFR